MKSQLNSRDMKGLTVVGLNSKRATNRQQSLSHSASPKKLYYGSTYSQAVPQLRNSQLSNQDPQDENLQRLRQASYPYKLGDNKSLEASAVIRLQPGNSKQRLISVERRPQTSIAFTKRGSSRSTYQASQATYVQTQQSEAVQKVQQVQQYDKDLESDYRPASRQTTRIPVTSQKQPKSESIYEHHPEATYGHQYMMRQQAKNKMRSTNKQQTADSQVSTNTNLPTPPSSEKIGEQGLEYCYSIKPSDKLKETEAMREYPLLKDDGKSHTLNYSATIERENLATDEIYGMISAPHQDADMYWNSPKRGRNQRSAIGVTPLEQTKAPRIRLQQDLKSSSITIYSEAPKTTTRVRNPTSPTGPKGQLFKRPVTSCAKGKKQELKSSDLCAQRSKIADIKKKLTLGESKVQLTRAKSSMSKGPRKGTMTKEMPDASINSLNISNIDDAQSVQVEIEEDLDELSPAIPGKPALLRSVYEGRPQTIFFQYPACCEKIRDVSRACFLKPEEAKKFDLKFKTSALLCVVRTFENAGFKRTEGNYWNHLWANPKHDRVKEMNKFQKTNHYAGCWQLGRKDNLWRNLSRMKRQFPNDFNFIPNTFLLNVDYQRFNQVKEAAESKALWIVKPCASACGRGIRVINKKTKIKKRMNYLVSEYIASPHLINGFKYDLRLYVLVSSYDPLRIYLHQEGLARFATRKYQITAKNLKERYIHLTNFSVNKHSSDFVKNQDTAIDNMGSKWSHTALKKIYEQLNIDHEDLWAKIKDIIIKTIISGEPSMLDSLNRTPEHRNNCYEIYGFDILMDSNLKPWLMEVNVCPSLSSSSPMDRKIKTTMMSDAMNLVGFQPYDKKKYEEDRRSKTPGTEGRRYQSKNTNDIADLNADNCLELLSPDDWNVLFETDEEFYRKGGFERIFPLKKNVDSYASYFEYQRYNNVMVWQWLKDGTNFLEKICRKASKQSV